MAPAAEDVGEDVDLVRTASDQIVAESAARSAEGASARERSHAAAAVQRAWRRASTTEARASLVCMLRRDFGESRSRSQLVLALSSSSDARSQQRR